MNPGPLRSSPAPEQSEAVDGPFDPEPLPVQAPDGVELAVFRVRAGDGGPVAGSGRRPPLILVHGAAADHTTWRASGPRLARRREVLAIDRRGRGGSGDTDAYTFSLEAVDLAAVAGAIAGRDGAVDVLGHSYGGRIALGTSLRTPAIRRVVAYEGAPSAPGSSYQPEGAVAAVRAAMARGDREAALEAFLAGIVGMSDAGLAAYRANPVWPARVAAAGTILREVDAEVAADASLEALARVAVPVLLILGSASRAPFHAATAALVARLPRATLAVIDGAAHAAHHTHVDAFVAAVEAFLDGD